MGCIFWAKFGRGGVDTLAESRWADLIGPSILVQKSTISQSTDGGLFVLANRPWDRTAALFVMTEMRGNVIASVLPLSQYTCIG